MLVLATSFHSVLDHDVLTGDIEKPFLCGTVLKMEEYK